MKKQEQTILDFKGQLQDSQSQMTDNTASAQATITKLTEKFSLHQTQTEQISNGQIADIAKCEKRISVIKRKF